MADKQGILVVAEVTPEGALDKVTLEMLGLGAKLAASSGKQLQAALVAGDTASLAAPLFAVGRGRRLRRRGRRFRRLRP